MVRVPWLITAFVAFGLVACKEDKKPPPTGSPQPADPAAKDTSVPTPEKPADPAPAAPQPIKASPNGEDLTLIPVDSELVAGVNLTQLAQSALWKQFVEPQLLKADAQAKLAEFKTKCGFDPIGAVQSASVGIKGLGGGVPEGVLVVHGPDKAKTLACVDKMKAESKGKVEVTQDGDVTVVKAKGDDDGAAFKFVSDTTALVVFGPKVDAARVKQVAAGGSPLRTSPAFVQMFNRINTQESAWLLMNGNSKAFDAARSLGMKPKALYGSVNVTDGVSVDMRMKLESADQATQLAQMAKAQSQAATSMFAFDKFDITSDSDDVKMAIAVSGAKLPTLIKQIKAMQGGRMGGMGTATP